MTELPTKAHIMLNDIATGIMWFGLLIVGSLFVLVASPGVG